VAKWILGKKEKQEEREERVTGVCPSIPGIKLQQQLGARA